MTLIEIFRQEGKEEGLRIGIERVVEKSIIKGSTTENIVEITGIKEEEIEKMLKSIFKGGCLQNLQSSLAGLVGSLGSIVILWVGSANVLSVKMSIGQLLIFNALLVYFLDPIKNLINLQPMMQTAIVEALSICGGCGWCDLGALMIGPELAVAVVILATAFTD